MNTSTIQMPVNQLLQSDWTFNESGKGQRYAAEVPGCVHTDLLRHGLIPEPYWGNNELDLQYLEDLDFDYHLDFNAAPELFEEQCIELVAEGLDTSATVILNGVVLGREENMFVEHRYRVNKHLCKGKNRLEIRFESPMKYIKEHWDGKPLVEMAPIKPGRALIRKEACSFGWDWGPRFATSGIWRPIRLEAWSVNLLDSVRMEQFHQEDGQVRLAFEPRLVRAAKGSLRGAVYLAGEKVADLVNDEALITDPQLWWPHGHGEAILYEVDLEWVDAKGVVRGEWKKRIGLRTIQLDRHPDEYGESFQFVVNGRALFAKGANWIPADCFPNRVDYAHYDCILSAAVDANMNMIRVWGGGIYEFEEFYDLCDEKGLLVWQDFMFACSLFRGDRAFLKSVRQEASQQVKRLAHRACLALWCGNNESEQMYERLLETPKRIKAYDDLFNDLLPEVVETLDGVTDYWPSSPHNPDGYAEGRYHPGGGDTHHWGVWHGRLPVKNYEEECYRFYSEFGMQSYSSPEVAATFCDPKDFNIFGPMVDSHQKCTNGNHMILDYMSRLYRFPKDYRATAYLSQLNQAYCMKVAIEHFRRNMPRTMGALYWQLNDCWPVASWSSLEYLGRWKALHHEARRFYAPSMLSLKVIGDEVIGVNNYVQNDMTGVEIHTAFDGTQDESALICWSLETLDGEVLRKGSLQVELCYGQSVLHESIDLSDDLEKRNKSELVFRAELSSEHYPVSRRTALFTAPRFLNLSDAPIRTKVRKLSAGIYELELVSKSYQHSVQVDLSGIEYRCDDNYFDLYGGTPRVVTLEIPSKPTLKEIRDAVTTYSLADSY